MLLARWLAAGVALLGCLAAGQTVANDLDQRADIGFALAEQQGFELDRDNLALGVGSYLVNASGCNDCHTWPNYTPNGNPYLRQPKQYNNAHFLAGGRAFQVPTETVCSPNLTPEPGTHKAAGLSREEFIHVMRTGCDPQDPNFHDADTCGLLQVMPWPHYQNMRRQELSAMYSFLSALPHAEPDSAAQCTPNPQGVAAQ